MNNTPTGIAISQDDIEYLAESWERVNFSGATTAATLTPAQIEALIHLANAVEDFLFPALIE